MDQTLFQPSWPGLTIHAASVTTQGETTYALVTTEQGQRLLAVQTPYDSSPGSDFDPTFWTGGERSLWLGPLSRQNAAWLRSRLDWLRPTPQGLRTSVGLGDRLGLATPGHLRAVRSAVHSPGSMLAPIPAQQSIREMIRTGRTPQQVLDDAMWGVFSEGWRKGFGADADHLKTPEDIDGCLAAGYTFFTFDPGQFVDDTAMHGKVADLWESLEKLPWEQLEDCLEDLFARYLDKPFVCETHTIVFDKPTLIQAAVKYGRAVAQVATLYRHLASRAEGQTWEVEVSVDETAFPTTHAEHIYLATELRRLGVHWVSLAPRFIGRFEKGVDYLGDPRAFEEDIAVHAAIARTLGPYKLSLHSGSDKFSIYGSAARQTQGLIHLKTAGTSYLEALRTVAAVDPDLMRSIYSFAREHYSADRASYHVSAELERAPSPVSFTAETATSLLDQFDVREILHVTFGSVLTAKMADGQRRFYDRIMDILHTYEEIYTEYLHIHFLLHLRPFTQIARGDM